MTVPTFANALSDSLWLIPTVALALLYLWIVFRGDGDTIADDLFTLPLHCCNNPNCMCETEAEAHGACDCTATADSCKNSDCCAFCHGRWAEYVGPPGGTVE